MMPRPFRVHGVPRFEGRRSRRHRNEPLWLLKLRAIAAGVRGGGRLSEAGTLVQFLGFPRSGHSLIGSVLDAHPHALISHELDLMGLLAEGFDRRQITHLIADNTRRFSRHGRYWNNFSYEIPGQWNGRLANGAHVIGDKKGDWAVRRLSRQPKLLSRLRDEFPIRIRWVVVVRNPFDNVSTLCLRKGRRYDQLRISARNEEEFRRQLRDPAGLGIPDRVDDEMLEDYLTLHAGLHDVLGAMQSEDWFHLPYESFLERPGEMTGRLCAFLGLEAPRDYIEAVGEVVRPRPHRTRERITWSPDQVVRVAEVVRRSGIFEPYEPRFDA
jgi:hypothetical protein